MKINFDKFIIICEDIGKKENNRGLCEALNISSLKGRRFVDVASKLKDKINSLDEAKYPPIRTIKERMALGIDGIYDYVPYNKEKITIVCPPNNQYYVWRGNHRAFALFLLGEEGIDISRKNVKRLEQRSREIPKIE